MAAVTLGAASQYAVDLEAPSIAEGWDLAALLLFPVLMPIVSPFSLSTL